MQQVQCSIEVSLLQHKISRHSTTQVIAAPRECSSVLFAASCCCLFVYLRSFINKKASQCRSRSFELSEPFEARRAREKIKNAIVRSLAAEPEHVQALRCKKKSEKFLFFSHRLILGVFYCWKSPAPDKPGERIRATHKRKSECRARSIGRKRRMKRN